MADERVLVPYDGKPREGTVVGRLGKSVFVQLPLSPKYSVVVTRRATDVTPVAPVPPAAPKGPVRKAKAPVPTKAPAKVKRKK